jgi:hypothetical protein
MYEMIKPERKIKHKYLTIRITDEQDSILEAKANSFGFNGKSSFVRFLLFTPANIAEKMDQIHKRIVKDGKE